MSGRLSQPKGGLKSVGPDQRTAEEVGRIRSLLSVPRLHYAYTVRTFESYREDYCYLYKNWQSLRVVPLFWRLREIRANEVVTDAAKHAIPTLPSGEARLYLLETLNQYSAEFLAAFTPAVRIALKPILDQLAIATGFDLTKKEIESVESAAETLENLYPGDLRCRALVDFARRLFSFYLPFAVVPAMVTGDFMEIRQGVDVNRPFIAPEESVVPPHTEFSVWDMLRFAAWGVIEFEMPIPIEAAASPPWVNTNSIHLQLNLPTGVITRSPPKALPSFLFAGTGVDRLASVNDAYVYSYLGGEEAREVRRIYTDLVASRDKMVRRLSAEVAKFLVGEIRASARMPRGSHARAAGPLESERGRILELSARLTGLNDRVKEAERPRFRVSAAVGPGVRLLTALLWVVVGLTYSIRFGGWLDAEIFAGLFSSLLLVVLAISVFSLDKPFVRFQVFTQVLAACLVFFELPVLIYLTRWLPT